MLPVIAYKLIESLRLRANVSRALGDAAFAGFTINESRLKMPGAQPDSGHGPEPCDWLRKRRRIAKKASAEGSPPRSGREEH